MPSVLVKYKVEFLVSTKAELITEKVNKWIEEHPEYDIMDIIPFMSYTSIKDKGAMMIGCMIKYYVFEPEEESPRENNTDDYESNDAHDVVDERRTEMIGKKDIALVNTGRKIVKKYKDNFSNFLDHEFYVRIDLVDEDNNFVKACEYLVNADNWLDYIESTDFGDLKVAKIEISASGR